MKMENKIKYQKLPETVNVKGTGIKGLTAKLVKRNEDVAIYLRSDNILEVFKIKKVEEEKIFKKIYPSREVYPGNDDFGKIAFAYPKRMFDEALEMFNNLSGVHVVCKQASYKQKKVI